MKVCIWTRSLSLSRDCCPAEDTAQYAEEHKNDSRYVEYNEQFDQLEKSLQAAEDEKNQKKRRKPRILGE